MKKSIKKTINCFFPILIFLITAFIAFRNYTPGTYLTGWDNLHPEFNFKLNIERSLNAAWQEYQGVGLLGGMGHAADLPRQLVLSGFASLMPTSLIRYFWTFLMLFIGPLGVYFLVLLSLKTKKYTSEVYLGAFTASIFYIFNLATVQYFFVPFETFIGFYGFLPWLIFFVLKYLKSGKTKDLLSYFLASIFATTAFYVQTLFLVYLVILGVIMVFSKLKRSFLILLVTLIVNSFWLLPVYWFSLTSNQIPQNSQINQIATPETVYMNQGRAGFGDIVNLRGYWFDYYDFDKSGEFNYLFQDWIDWTIRPYVKEIGIGLFAVSVVGLLISTQFEWLVLLGMGYLMLNQIEIPIPVLSEAFRNSFTKWSVAFSFVISIGIGYFVAKFRKISILPAAILVGLSIYSVYPILDGKLVSSRVKTNIPDSYFEVFDWFNNQTGGERVAYFPAFDKWGWNYHDWGYGGSGFIWYGIKNPVLDRAFNVWSPYNEGFYNEITKAILDNDVNIFKNTINKYQVKYLLVDDSVLFPWGEKSLLKIDTIKNFTEELGYQKVKEDNFLSVFDTGLEINNFISAPLTYTFIDADLTYSQVDPIYKKYGDYVQSESATGYPFINFDSRSALQISIMNNESVTDEVVSIKNENINSEIRIPIENKLEESFEEGHGYPDSHNCDLKDNGSVERTQLTDGRNYLAEDGGVSCDYFVFGDVQPEKAYILHVSGENKEGRSLKVYLYNWESKRVELEELLPEGYFDTYYVVYPNNTTGYTLNIETRSFGKVSSENEINTLELIPFDIELVSKLQNDTYQSTYNLQPTTNNLKIKNVKKYGTAIYKVEVTGNGLLWLAQGFEPGWITFPKLEHVRVNTWSNGWVVPATYYMLPATIYLLFWPQLLEWLGFLLLFLTVGVIVLKLTSVKKSSR